MTDITPYITAGWHTIPHTKPTIYREGKDKIFGVPTKWQKYKEEWNEVATPVGSVIPGPQSNLIVIDCDSTKTTELFEQLLPDYKAVTYSIDKKDKDGKEIKGSNWFFFYQPNIPVMHNGLYNLEIFSGDGDTQQVFLPTKGNKTKTSWAHMPKLMAIPPTIVTLLNVWSKASKPHAQPIVSNGSSVGQHTFNLAPLIEKQLSRDSIVPQLFSIITPSAFRNDLYRDKGYLHPNDIVDGSGNDYFIKVSAILGSDCSISKDLYTRMMHYINDLWEQPYSAQEINKRIDRMVSGLARVNGLPIWDYDPQWEFARFMDHNKIEEMVEYFIDPSLLEVIEVNHTTHITRVLKRGLATALTQLTTKGKDFVGKNKVEKFQMAIPSMVKVTRPNKPFGPLVDDRFKYNTFMASPALEVIRHPESYKDRYNPPVEFIAYMESLVPKKLERTYLLRHLLTKLSTFGYSPAVYYFVGVPGSGKGLFVSLINKLMGGEQYVGQNLGSSEILGVTNGWLEGLLFAHFDELHDTLGKYEDRKKANGNIKKWSGSEVFQLRRMHTESVTEPMMATFILTQNGSAFNMDVGDRRYLYMDTPNVLDKDLAEGMVDLIANRIEDIAYYLHNEYEQLPMHEYVKPPMTDDKLGSIMSKQPAEIKILSAIDNRTYGTLYQLAIDSGMDMAMLTQYRSKNLIYEDALIWMYKGLTDSNISGAEVLNLFKAAIKHGQLKGQPSAQQMYHNNKWTITAHGFMDTVEPGLTSTDGLEEIEV